MGWGPAGEMTMRVSRRGSWRRCGAAAAAALLLLVVAASGCRRDGGAPTAAGAPRRYTVRGEVVRGVEPGGSSAEILFRHEAIDDFVDRDGRVMRMAPMVMPFEVGPALSRGLAAGDKAEIRFTVDWSKPSFRVEHVEKLPPTTQLRFRIEDSPEGGARPNH